jgi:hypothetical protein
MHAYPPYVDANEVDQLKITGTAEVDSYDAADPSQAGQIGLVHLDLKNLTGSPLDISQLRFRGLSSGGYMLFDVPYNGGSIPAGATQTYDNSGFGTPMRANALQVQILAAQDAKHQRNSINIPIAQLTGRAGPLVATTQDPVFIGLWANPVEIIPLWLDGKKQHWVTISGHIVNGFPEVESKLTIVRVHLA